MLKHPFHTKDECRKQKQGRGGEKDARLERVDSYPELQSDDVLRHTGAKRSDRLAPVVAWEALFYSSMAAAATAAVYVSALALRLT